MTQEGGQSVKGAIVVRERQVLHTFQVGAATVTHIYVDGRYSGDIDGLAVETLVAVTDAHGSETHYG